MMIRWICAVLLLLGATNAATGEPLTSTEKIVSAFMELDINNDDGVSYKEYMAMVQQRARTRFRIMDANRDNKVSPAEYRHFWRTQKAQWYRLNR